MRRYRKSVWGSLLAWGVMTAGGQAEPAGGTATNVPPVVVRQSVLQEAAPVGPYAQPEWTTQRRFATTRVFLQQPPYSMGAEEWWRVRHFRDGTTSQQFQEEFEMGLPHRVQVDLYHTWGIENDGYTHHKDFSAEARYALADWGRLPLNPTVYAEWKFVDEEADVYEVKLLLGDDIGSSWHYGLNGTLEQQVGDGRATEIAVGAALGYTLVDRKLGIGAESKYTHESEQGARGDAENKLLLGPSVQWRPIPGSHIDLVPLFGLNHDSPRIESYIVAGIDFGPGTHAKSVAAPVSTIRN